MKYLIILTKNLQESAGPISFMLMPSELLRKAHATMYTKIWAAIDAVYLMVKDKSIYIIANEIIFDLFSTLKLYMQVYLFFSKKKIYHEQIESGHTPLSG